MNITVFAPLTGVRSAIPPDECGILPARATNISGSGRCDVARQRIFSRH